MKQWMLAGVSLVAVMAVARPATLLSQANERSMYVSMLDKSGAPVENLTPSDFIVREDNLAREVLRVAPATDPMQIAILVDNSTAAAPQIPHIRRGLPAFVERLTTPTAAGRHNQVAIITLAGRPIILADYAIEAEPLKKAVERIWEETVPGGYYLLNGIIEISQGFRKRESARPVIVAIVTEGPELSARDPAQVLAPLADSGAAFHVITLGTPTVTTSDDDRYRNTVLDEGPRLSGGTRAQLLAGSALPARLQQLAEVLTRSYLVTYARPERLIPPQRITVSARRADLTAHGTPVKESQARQ